LKRDVGNSVRDLVGRNIITAAINELRLVGRDRALSVPLIVLALLHFVVEGLASFKTLVEKLNAGEVNGLPAVEVSREGFCKRLETVDHHLFLGILRHVTRKLASTQRHGNPKIKALAPFATGIFAIDDTTLDALVRHSKALKDYAKGAMETLAGRLGCAIDLATHAYVAVLFDSDSKANEKNHILPLIDAIGPGNLFVLDLGYFAFHLFDAMSNRYTYFVTRMRDKATYHVATVMCSGDQYRDQIIFLGKHRSDRSAYPVRLVELRINGVWWRYITNVLDPQVLDARQIFSLYQARWNIEKSFAAIKRALGLAALRATHVNGVLIQIWSTLIVYQVLQNLRLDIAAAAGWDADDVSWAILVMRIGWYTERPRTESLRAWLTQGAKRLSLKKQGTRPRRRDDLPPEVDEAVRRPPRMPSLSELAVQVARQGKPKPRRTSTMVVVGGLTLG
jgi:hypothetical protein